MVKKLILGTLISILSMGILAGCGKNTAAFISSETVTVDSGMETESADSQAEEPREEEPRTIFVYVCGEVEIPGVYALVEGSRVCDLFQMAGGLTAEAASDYWNQARILVDGEMLYVPTIEEAMQYSKEEWENAGAVGNSQQTDKGENKKININTASKEELMTLPGIGESKALAIIAYRKELGRFTSVEDIKEIPGIKDAVFSKIKDFITVN